MEGLDGTFKDFASNKSFETAPEFHKHMNGRGKVGVVGHLACRICSGVQAEFRGRGNIDPITGLANIVCPDCKREIAAEVAAE